MRHMVCASVNRVLEAYHDGELPVEQQIVVETHLAECYACAAEAKSLRQLRDALRATADVTSSDTVESSLASMSAAVISRVKAERHESLPARVGRMFEDLHLVWAGVAATSATVTCAAIVAGVLYFAPAERGDSLAGVISALAAPGSDRNPMLLDDRDIKLPRFELQPTMPTMPAVRGEDPDVTLAVSGVVTQDGRVAFPSLLSSPYSTADDQRLIHAVSSARFEPATRSGAPVAVNFVWLLERTTVRGERAVTAVPVPTATTTRTARSS
jgi:Putative zinc-finger